MEILSRHGRGPAWRPLWAGWRVAWMVAGALGILLTTGTAHADVRLPALLSDGMVLQEKSPARVWGWANDGEKVTVSFRGHTAVTHAAGGKWQVTVESGEPGGPFAMTISGSSTITLKDVLVGEVWVCSGQSNMEFGLAAAYDAKKEIEAPGDTSLRMFTVAKRVADAPLTDVVGRWESATPEYRGHFSAVGYYFGRALRRARGVPVGLIHTSWGGTPAEAWTSRSALQAWGLPPSSFRGLAPVNPRSQEDYGRRVAAWKAAGWPQGRFEDPGVADEAKRWAWPQTDTKDWRTMSLPRAWETSGSDMEIDGAVWFRREIDVPAAWAGKDLELGLGAIDDFDTTYFNGVQVGATGADAPRFWDTPRRYRVPGSQIKAGRAVVAVRVWDQGGNGGLMGPAEAMWLAPWGSSQRVALSGDWWFKVERKRASMPGGPPGSDPNAPGVLYNAMIAPLLPFTIKGAAWYQGEANTGHAAQYRSLLSTMIQSWRTDWAVGAFPFLIVELAPFMEIKADPEESEWAALREAQLQVSQSVPNVGTVVITDVGDDKDIHPTKKQPVGERLSLAARKIAYHENIEAFGPTFKSMTISEGKAVVHFDHVGRGLEAHGDRLTGFALAGSDRRFVFADAVIAGDTVVASSPRVPAPLHLRFGWANFPVVNLWNKDGLPASPFRTDGPPGP
jgi:sialate O-acetylesterase